MKNLKRKARRILAFVMTFAMCFNMLNLTALASEAPVNDDTAIKLQAEKQIAGYVDNSGKKTQETTVKSTDGLVTATKEIQATGVENLFDVTMTVTTKDITTTTTTSKDAAVVLVFDMSLSKGVGQSNPVTEATKQFLEDYTKDAHGKRMVAFVTVNSYAAIKILDENKESSSPYWIDVAQNSNLGHVQNTVAGSLTGTGLEQGNVQGGLVLANNLYNEQNNWNSAIKGIKNRYVVFITAAEPSYGIEGNYNGNEIGFLEQAFGVGYGSSEAKEPDEAKKLAKEAAMAIQKLNPDVQSYAICLGNAQQDWMQNSFDSVGTASNATDIQDQLKDIITSITTKAESVKVQEILEPNMELTANPANADMVGNGTFSWDLSKLTPADNADGSKTYTMSYQVHLNNRGQEEAKKDYVTCDKSYVSYNVDNKNNIELHFAKPVVTGYTADLSFKKVNEENQALPGAEFALFNADKKVSKASSSTNTGLVEFKAIPSGETYTLSETNTPSAEYDAVADKAITVAYGKASGFEATVVDPYHVEREPVVVIKQWLAPAGESIPEEISFTVGKYLADKQIETKVYTVKKNDENVVLSNGDRTWTITLKDDDGQDLVKKFRNEEYSYKVIAETPINGYDYKLGDLSITNIRADKIDIPVQKTWILPADIDPNSMTATFELQRFDSDGKAEKAGELTLTGNATGTFKDMPEYDSNGQKIKYAVVETKSSGKLIGTPEPDEKGVWQFTNSVNCEETVAISGIKRWNEAYSVNHDTDVIIVNLLQNGKQFAAVQASAETGWKYSFQNLPKYESFKDDKGNITGVGLYKYEVQEAEFDGYQATYNGFDIANTPTETVDVTVEKVWQDHKDSHEPVLVQLLADGEIIAKDWVASQHTFTGLPKYKVGGSLIKYSVAEPEVAGGYAAYYSQQGDNHFVITNVLQDKVTVQVNKKWLQPSSIADQTAEFELYQDGRATGSTLEITGNGSGQFTGLEMYYLHNNGTPDDPADDYWAEHEYSVGEIASPANYAGMKPEQSAAAGDNDNATYTFNFVNVIKGETSVTVNKTWEDGALFAADPSYQRPEAVFAVTRSIEGKPDNAFAGELKLANNENSTTLTGLDKYNEQGQPYTYMVEEETLANYYPIVENKSTEDAFVYDVANILSPGSIDVTVSKVWQDELTNADRPAEIILNLLRDGKTVHQVIFHNNNGVITPQADVEGTLNVSDNTWSYTFAGQLKYTVDGSAAYVYTAEEAGTPEGYASSAVGTTVFNTAVGNNYGITISKHWLAPVGYELPEITLTLHGDRDYTIIANSSGATFDGKTMEFTSAGNSWTFTTPKLPQYDSLGKTIQYSLSENSVAGFDSEIQGFTVTNTIQQEQITVAARKVWELGDSNISLPDSITVALYRNGNIIAGSEQTVRNIDGSFSIQPWNVDRYDLTTGQPYIYTVRELDGANTIVAEGGELSFGDNSFTVGYTEADGVQVITNTYKEPAPAESYSYRVHAHYVRYWANGSVRSSHENQALVQNAVYGYNEVNAADYTTNPVDGLVYTFESGDTGIEINSTTGDYTVDLYFVLRDTEPYQPPVTDDNGGGDDSGDGGDGDEGSGTGDETVADIDDEPAPLAELPDEDIPMATLPDVDDDSFDNEEEILDEDVPMSDVPKTGDSLLLWFFAAAVSGLAALATGRKRK